MTCVTAVIHEAEAAEWNDRPHRVLPSKTAVSRGTNESPAHRIQDPYEQLDHSSFFVPLTHLPQQPQLSQLPVSRHRQI